MKMTIQTIKVANNDTIKATMTIDGKKYDATYRPKETLRGGPFLLVHNLATMRYMHSWSKRVMVQSFLNDTLVEMEIAQ